MFVKCLIENPAFDSQTKETLTTTVSRFGSKCTLSERTINAVAKSPILEGVHVWAQTKAQVCGRRSLTASFFYTEKYSTTVHGCHVLRDGGVG